MPIVANQKSPLPDAFIREKFTKERTTARKQAAEYFQRFPKDRYQTVIESWRELQSQNRDGRRHCLLLGTSEEQVDGLRKDCHSPETG